MLPLFYANRAITTEQFKNATELIEVYIDNVPKMMSLRDYVTFYTGYTYGDGVYGWSILWLIVIISIFAGMSILGSKFIRFK